MPVFCALTYDTYIIMAYVFCIFKKFSLGEGIFCLSSRGHLGSVLHSHQQKVTVTLGKQMNQGQCRILAESECNNYTFKPHWLLRYHLIMPNSWLPIRCTPNAVMFLKLLFTESFLKCVQIALCPHGEPF